jgi:hypothetical protein
MNAVHDRVRRTLSQRENALQRDIEAAIGAEPDLLLFKNSVGRARFATAEGRVFHVPYGLCVGSPDLVGILAPRGRWFCREVKVPGEAATAEQAHIHDAWRSFGAFVRVVHSVDEARAALLAARFHPEAE